MRNIICHSDILGGKPVIEGTRLSVEHILGLLSHGMTQAEVSEAYPELTVADIHAVLGYAADALRNDVIVDVKPVAGV